MSAPLIWFTSSWRIACAAHTYGPVIEPSSTPAAGAPFIVAVSSLPVWSPRQSGCRSAPVNTRNPCRGIPLCLRRGQLRGLLSTSSVHDGGGGVGCDGGPPGGGDGCCVGQPGLATIAITASALGSQGSSHEPYFGSHGSETGVWVTIPEGSLKLIGSPFTYAYLFQLAGWPGLAVLIPPGSTVQNLPIPDP